MRAVVAILVVLLSGVPAMAQTCTPVKLTFHSGWQYNAATVYGEWVPAGEVWLIQFAGVASNDGRAFQPRLQQQRPAADGTCCWLIPGDVSTAVAPTPQQAIGRAWILEAGDRIAARTNITLGDLALLYSGWKFPDTCLPRLLGVDVPVSAGGTIPNLAPLVTAATAAAATLTQAASDLTALSQSVP